MRDLKAKVYVQTVIQFHKEKKLNIIGLSIFKEWKRRLKWKTYSQEKGITLADYVDANHAACQERNEVLLTSGSSGVRKIGQIAVPRPYHIPSSSIC